MPGGRTQLPELLEANARLLQLAEQLTLALESRIMIEQAKGILAERHNIDVGTAFEALRRAARSNQLRLHDLAEQVVAERVTPPLVARHLGS